MARAIVAGKGDNAGYKKREKQPSASLSSDR